MNVVLYTNDFEPITVLDLPVWLLDQLEKQGAVRVAVLRPPSIHTDMEDMAYLPEVVTIYCEKMRWKDGKTKTVLVTNDDELALTLRPDWLPGQRQAIQGYQKAVKHLTENLIRAMRK